MAHISYSSELPRLAERTTPSILHILCLRKVPRARLMSNIIDIPPAATPLFTQNHTPHHQKLTGMQLYFDYITHYVKVRNSRRIYRRGYASSRGISILRIIRCCECLQCARVCTKCTAAERTAASSRTTPAIAQSNICARQTAAGGPNVQTHTNTHTPAHNPCPLPPPHALPSLRTTTICAT